jgi:hypothetical protein
MDEAGVPQAEVDLFMHATMAHDYATCCGGHEPGSGALTRHH